MTKLLAYADSFSGLVPCRVIAIDGNYVDVKITAKRPGYNVGDFAQFHKRYVWPRDAAKPKRGSYGLRWIVGPYDWQDRLGVA